MSHLRRSMNELFELRDGLMSDFEAARAAKKIEKRRGKNPVGDFGKGVVFNIFSFYTENWGRFPFLTIIFFKWVETKPPTLFLYHPVSESDWVDHVLKVGFCHHTQVGSIQP